MQSEAATLQFKHVLFVRGAEAKSLRYGTVCVGYKGIFVI